MQPGHIISAWRYLGDDRTTHARHRDLVHSSSRWITSTIFLTSLNGIGSSSSLLCTPSLATHTCEESRSVVFRLFMFANFQPRRFVSQHFRLLVRHWLKHNCLKLINCSLVWANETTGKTLTVFGYLFLISMNFYDFLLGFSFNWEGISNTQESVWSHFQTPRRLLKILSCAHGIFSSLLLEMWSQFQFLLRTVYCKHDLTWDNIQYNTQI